MCRRLLILKVSASVNYRTEFNGRSKELCVSLEIIIETNALYIPEGNAIAERGVETIMGTTRRLLLGRDLHTPTDVLDG